MANYHESSKTIDNLFVGQVYHSVGIDEMEYLNLALIGVSKDGKIELFRNIDTSNLITEDLAEREIQNLKDKGWKIEKTVILKNTEFLIPGLVDTHIHAPQYTYTGTGYDLELLDWLETYTFPKEAEFKSTKYALEQHTKVVKKTLSCGTTTACYFATIHKDSSVILAEVCKKLGQRAFVGKVNMDRNSPEGYIEASAEESLKDTEGFIKKVQSLKSDLITPIITPRFVPSCTPTLLHSLSKLASKFNLPIQSHMSENHGEIAWVKELHPEVDNYAAVYEKFGLLGEKTVMAHCIHMNDDERALMLKKKVGIAHCPSSNFSLTSGVLNVRRLIDEGFAKIGLGTDCAGGYSPSIMDSMRQAVIASKVVHINYNEREDGPDVPKSYKALNYKQAFYLGTLGGARVMGLEDKIGNFKVGKQFDAIVVDTSFALPKRMLSKDPPPVMDVFDHDDPWAIFEKFIYLGDDRLMTKIYVAGNLVVESII